MSYQDTGGNGVSSNTLGLDSLSSSASHKSPLVTAELSEDTLAGIIFNEIMQEYYDEAPAAASITAQKLNRRKGPKIKVPAMPTSEKQMLIHTEVDLKLLPPPSPFLASPTPFEEGNSNSIDQSQSAGHQRYGLWAPAPTPHHPSSGTGDNSIYKFHSCNNTAHL